MPARILLVDPRTRQREALHLALDTDAWTLLVADDASAAIEHLAGDGADVAICDPALPGLDGFELAPQLKRRAPALQVFITSAHDRAERFELAEGLDADGVLDDPLDPAQLRFALRGALRRVEREREVRVLERDLSRATGDTPIVGASAPMIELLESMERAAGFKTPVLIQGERGTHPEVLARAIHAQSLRRLAPFVSVHCADGAPEAVERRLFDSADDFGTARAHGTSKAESEVRLASGGTLFLDEVTRLSEAAQTRLLHLLDREEVIDSDTSKARPADVRVIAAVQQRSGTPLAPDALLPDLADRLGSVVLDVPPLRECSQDIPLLVDHAIARLRGALAVDVASISDSAMERLRHYEWPGNLAELENTIERAMLLAHADRITLHDLPAMITTAVADAGEGRSGDFSLRRARRSFEAEMIRRALSRTDGNRTRAARLLEISHRALLYKIKEYGLRD